MKRLAGAVLTLLALAPAPCTSVIVWAAALDSDARANLAQLPKVTTPRVYVLNCGELISNNPELYSLSREEVADTNMPVTCYLVVHPKGILLYDTGLADRLVGRPVWENIVEGYGEIKTTTLVSELANIGVTPADVTYIALSHMHFDHAGNAGLFNRSTWLTTRAEQAEMFAASRPGHFADYADLESARKVVYDGDHDVFGDGTVVLKSTPGHTPGHQSLFLKLAKTGNVLVSGDLYHYTEELTKGRMPPGEMKTATPASRQAMVEFVSQTKAQLWIGHSTGFYRSALKSPAWYE
ncbi:N-acyl homoserine lactonase family protein [Novosphingobium sp. AP12]|uniref:N-acyl homoserine lactonase family protein n=1 Tax=Novosphingobium sp. AP12 TaxID=1144305 RepID=UPI000271EC5B|nr:N-acyl homoserine lactonase family protein [Novosphingobium sp. AP12]EJL31261.1 Zn-dependent hydrolase, glyoxylase [Novosphingobium sp. AP12]